MCNRSMKILLEGSTTTPPIDIMDDIGIKKWIDRIEANTQLEPIADEHFENLTNSITVTGDEWWLKFHGQTDKLPHN